MEEHCREQPCVHSTPKEINPDNAQSMGKASETVLGSVEVASALMLHHCCYKSKIHSELEMTDKMKFLNSCFLANACQLVMLNNRPSNLPMMPKTHEWRTNWIWQLVAHCVSARTTIVGLCHKARRKLSCSVPAGVAIFTNAHFCALNPDVAQ